MRIIIPQTVGDAELISSTIAEDDYAEWAVGTTYDRGDFVISTDTHTVYRSLTDTNLGNDPDVEQVALADPLIDDPDPVSWQIISATERWKMFDQKPSVPSVAADEIEVQVKPSQLWGGLAGFGIDAQSVTISVTSDSDGLVFERTLPLQDETIVTDWYSYFFEPIAEQTEFVVTDVPPYGDSTATVTFTRTGANVSVGELVFGGVRSVGTTMVDNTGFTGLDFSFVQQDEFGDLTTVRRAATRIADFEVFLSSRELLGFDSLMRALRGGVSAVWIGDPDPRKAAINYGFVRDYRAVYKSSNYSVMSLQIQGIV